MLDSFYAVSPQDKWIVEGTLLALAIMCKNFRGQGFFSRNTVKPLI